MDEGLSSIWILLLCVLIVLRLLNNLLRSGYQGLGDIYQKALAERLKNERPNLARALDHAHLLESSVQTVDALGLVAVVSLLLSHLGFEPNVFLALGLYVVIADILVPFYLARHHTEAFVIRLFPLVSWLYFFVRPIALLAGVLAKIGKRFEDKRSEEIDETPAELNAFIEAGAEEGFIEEKQRILVQNILNIDETVAREIMTPRTDMQCVPMNAERPDVLGVFKECKFSRLPVYKKDIDTIEGMVRLKDLVNEEHAKVSELVMPVLYIHEDMNVADLMTKMLRTRIQMAVVLDQYSGTSGLITLEDVIEEIVGEIHDEHESPDGDEVIRLEDGSYLVDGRFNISDFEKRFAVSIESEDVDTIGGYIFMVLGRIPDVGTLIDLAGMQVEIIRSDERRIYQVKIYPVVHDEIGANTD